MLLVPDPETAYLDPFTRHTTLNLLLREGPGDGRDVLRDPRQVARKAELYLQQTGIADVVLGPTVRVLHLRLGPLRPEPARGLLPPRRDRGRVELRPRARDRRRAEPRLQAPVQGGLLPPASHGPLPGPAFGDAPQARAGRAVDRSAPPRGRDRRPGRDRHAVLDAARDRRQRHEVQVRRQEHGAPGGQDGHVHAEAAVPGQRLGHAHTRACGRTTRTCSGTRSATRGSRTPRVGTSEG